MKETLEIGSRIRKLRKEKGFTQSFVASRLFISQSAYSMVESSSHSLSANHLVRLCRLFNVSADYLLMGHKKLSKMMMEKDFIPLLNTKAHAGLLRGTHDLELADEVEYYRIPGFNPTRETILVEVEGKSMEPTVMGGDVLVCQKQQQLDRVLDGSLGILVTDEDFLLKRIRLHSDENYFWVESDNLDEPEKQEIKKKDVFALFMVKGKVSHVLVPRYELAYKGKIKEMTESLESLQKEVYRLNKKTSPSS